MRAAFHPQKSRTWHVQHRHFAWAAFLRSENSCLKELPLTIGETSVGRTSEGSRYGGSQDEQHGHGPQGAQRSISAAHSVVLQPPDLTGTVLGQLLRGSGKRDAVNSVQEAKAFRVQSVLGLTRVLNCALEANIRQATQPNTPVMTFMVETRQPLSTDSLWIRRRARGKQRSGKSSARILFQPVTKYNEGNTLDMKWQFGLFMGVQRERARSW